MFGLTQVLPPTVLKDRLLMKHESLSWGSGQHRGWFQSSLITSHAINKKSPYKNVLTHGFVVDAEGQKMSKSVGNIISPQRIIKDKGADIQIMGRNDRLHERNDYF